MNFIANGIAILTGIFVAWLDKQDWECPNLYSPRAECAKGTGMPILNTKPGLSDTIADSLNRIKRASEAERQIIK